MLPLQRETESNKKRRLEGSASRENGRNNSHSSRKTHLPGQRAAATRPVEGAAAVAARTTDEGEAFAATETRLAAVVGRAKAEPRVATPPDDRRGAEARIFHGGSERSENRGVLDAGRGDAGGSRNSGGRSREGALLFFSSLPHNSLFFAFNSRPPSSLFKNFQKLLRNGFLPPRRSPAHGTLLDVVEGKRKVLREVPLRGRRTNTLSFLCCLRR